MTDVADTPTVSTVLAPAVAPSLGRSVSIDHAARLLHCSRRTIYNRIRDGRLRTVRTLGGSQRVLIESLQDHGFDACAIPVPAAVTAMAQPPLPATN
jgi:excisionase family DNA binding protein